MNIDKIVKGYSLLCGACAGYYAYQAMDKKTCEMVQEGGSLNAFLIGAGAGAIVLAIGLGASNAVYTFMKEVG